MIKFRTLALACSLALGTVVLVATPDTAHQALAADAAPKLTKEVAKPLKEAQGLIEKKQLDAALAKLKEADAVANKTPEDEYWINQFLVSVYSQQKKYNDAAAVMEKLINSGKMPQDQIDERLKALASTYFQLKDYNKTEEYAKRWLKNHPGDPDMTALLGQTQYLLKDYKSAQATMGQLIASAEKAGQTPKELWLQIQMSSVYSLDPNNKDSLSDSLKRLVRFYPKPEHWDNLLTIVSRKDNPDKVKLGIYRLMLEQNVLKTKDQYGDMAELALSAGVPAEAQKVVEAAYAQKGLVPDADRARFERRLVAAKKQAAGDKATIDKQAKDAEAAPTGQADAGVGQAYASFGMYDKAVAAYQRALKKGSLKDADETQVDLGVALFKLNQREQARAAFKAVPKDSKWAELAELWNIKVGQPG